MKINGANLRVYLDNVSTNEAIAYATECNLSIDVSMQEATDKSNQGFRDLLAGITTWSVDTSMLCTFDQGNINADELTRRQLNKERVFIKIDTVGTQGNTFYYWGQALIANLSITSTNEDVVTMTMTLEGYRTLRQIVRTNFLSTGLNINDIGYSGNNIFTANVSGSRLRKYEFKSATALKTASLTPSLISAEGNKVAYVFQTGGSLYKVAIYNTDNAEDTNVFDSTYSFYNLAEFPLKAVKLSGDFVMFVDVNNDIHCYQKGNTSRIIKIDVGTKVHISSDTYGFYNVSSGTAVNVQLFKNIRKGINSPISINFGSPFTDGPYTAAQNATYYLGISKSATNVHSLLFINKISLNKYTVVLGFDTTTTNDFKILVDENDDIIVYGYNSSAGILENQCNKYNGRDRSLKGEYTSVVSQAQGKMIKAVNCSDGLIAFADTSGPDVFIEFLNNVL
jgi:predicted secreted protein